MDERPRSAVDEPVRRVRTGELRRGLTLPLVLVAIALALAIVKPWGIVAPPSADQPETGQPARPGTPPPLASADPYAQLVATCGSPSGWRAATLQHWIGRASPIRTWSAIDPVVAAGPTDPRIPFARIATDLVTGIGYCAPRGAARPPSEARGEIWVLGERPRRVDPRRLEPLDENALGGIWLPTASDDVVVDGQVGWRPGRYAIRVRGDSFDRWLGIQIEAIRVIGSPAPADSSAAAAPGPAATRSP